MAAITRSHLDQNFHFKIKKVDYNFLVCYLVFVMTLVCFRKIEHAHILIGKVHRLRMNGYKE